MDLSGNKEVIARSSDPGFENIEMGLVFDSPEGRVGTIGIKLAS